MDYPEEWNELPKHKRRKLTKKLRKERQKKQTLVRKLRNIIVALVIFAISAFGYRLVTRKSPEEAAFEQEIEEVSLEDKVEEFEVMTTG